MKRKRLMLGMLLFTGSMTFAQKPADALTKWSATMPIEKIYLHFDRDNYVAGETVWFKAYLSSDYQPDTISTSLYVELLNGPSTVLYRQVLPVIFGSANGQFDLPDTLQTGNYLIRAYTATMLNLPPGHKDIADALLYEKQLFVFGKKPVVAQAPVDKKLLMEFFPEGGNFVTELNNSVAFKITDENGLPVNVNGIVENENGEKITEFTSYHDGMGVFDILPGQGNSYYAKPDGDPQGQKFLLPASAATGIVFRLLPDERGNFYEIFINETEKRRPAYMIGQMQHHIIFKKELPQGKNEWSGIIDTRKSASGIMQVTVFDEQDIPMAERLVFIDNKEYQINAVLNVDTLSFKNREKNNFSVSFNDTITGSFSVAITDADYSLTATSRETIVSGLLLTSDLKGYIHNPAYYFSSTTDSVKNALDLLMMVNGWRRFKWNALTATASNKLQYKDDGYITVSGKVTLKDTNKPVTDYSLLVLITSADSLQNGQEMLNTDKDGRFRMDSMIFSGRTSFYVSDIKGKKSKWIDIHPDADSLSRVFPLVAPSPAWFTRKSFLDNNMVSRLSTDYDVIAREKGQMLEAVTLKSRKKSPLQELDEKYASGLFQGLSQKTIDLVNSNEKIYHRNIFDYIEGRVTGVDIVRDGIDYTLYYRNNFSMSSGRIPMTLYLDEMLTDASIISTIPADQVAMIKVYSSFVGAEGNGPGGVLAIYTKKGSDITSLRTSADIFTYQGYSIAREFYSPDYSVNAEKVAKPDHRITLSWQPLMLINAVNAKIPLVFYNNDRTKRYRLIAEGMTWDGRLVHIEKIIGGGQQ